MGRLFKRRSWPALFSSLLLAGCATYSSTVGQMEEELAAGNAAGALVSLEKRQTPERDRVLFLLDKAMLQRLTGDYSGSNGSFEEAKRRMDSLSAASATETAGSFLINDATRSYEGEPFEQALMHVYAALNYIDLKQPDEARVEALQVEQRLKELNQRGAEALTEDPFARYLAGLIYEMKGESSDALISYRSALEAYRAHGRRYGAAIPDALKRDMLRLTESVGLHDEHKKLKKEFGSAYVNGREYAQSGELIFFLHSGLAPIKREHTSVIYPPLAAHVVTIALPFYEERGNPVDGARLALGSSSAQTETVEDVNAIATASLEKAMPVITSRAIARAVAKFQITDKAGRDNSPMVGLLANVAGILTERADTRSWLTLPGEIQMARMLAPPGDYKLRVELLGVGGGVLATREFDVHLEKGKKSFLSYHWIPSFRSGRMR